MIPFRLFVRDALACALLVLAVLALLAGSAFAQEPIRNPTGVLFTHEDYDALGDDGRYEIDIVAAGVVAQTILVSKRDTRREGADIVCTINVQPVKFGRYVVRVRAVASGGEKSSDSEPTAEWLRAPGAPSQTRTR